MSTDRSTGAVIIGRNEGGRLTACISSVLSQCSLVVYVDSGSTDESVKTATSLGVHVVELDMSTPFTAARARNAGLSLLHSLSRDIAFVQFIDGDCTLHPGWLAAATTFLNENPSYSVVFGRRRERFPERSIYNRLCDLEWNSSSPGDALYCGGDALMRIQAVIGVNGYRESLIAGEEPDLCVRLRMQGWRIRRISDEMTAHDAAITKFSQWWRRSDRAGHAFVEGFCLHGASPFYHWRRETFRAIAWGFIYPISSIILSTRNPFFLLLLLAYPIQISRIAWRGTPLSLAFLLVVGKFPEAMGVARFIFAKIRGKQNNIIEYK